MKNNIISDLNKKDIKRLILFQEKTNSDFCYFKKVNYTKDYIKGLKDGLLLK